MVALPNIAGYLLGEGRAGLLVACRYGCADGTRPLLGIRGLLEGWFVTFSRGDFREGCMSTGVNQRLLMKPALVYSGLDYRSLDKAFGLQFVVVSLRL